MSIFIRAGYLKFIISCDNSNNGHTVDPVHHHNDNDDGDCNNNNLLCHFDCSEKTDHLKHSHDLDQLHNSATTVFLQSLLLIHARLKKSSTGNGFRSDIECCAGSRDMNRDIQTDSLQCKLYRTS
jgi:hypothetical protein